MSSVKGRTMVITGGAGNVGLAIIRMALERGMNVAFLSGWHSKAQAAIEKLDPKYRDQLCGYAQDPQFMPEKNLEDAPALYTRETTQRDVMGWIAERFGGIDVMLNGSGDHKWASFDTIDPPFWRNAMQQLETAFFSTQYAMPYLEKSPAPRVINLTTADGRGGGYRLHPAYAACRGGMVSLTHELARELGPRGVTVNCVLTGHIEEDVPDMDRLSDEMRSRMVEMTPLGRLGVPGDVAGVVNFLMTDEASFINGAVIDVNGGMITCG